MSHYKEIKNYIHNDLKISKEAIQFIIMDRIDDVVKYEVSKRLNDKQWIENLVKKEVIRQMKINQPRNSYLRCTTDQLYNKIDKIIHDEVLKRLIVDLRDNPTDEDVEEGSFSKYRNTPLDELPDLTTTSEDEY